MIVKPFTGSDEQKRTAHDTHAWRGYDDEVACERCGVYPADEGANYVCGSPIPLVDENELAPNEAALAVIAYAGLYESLEVALSAAACIVHADGWIGGPTLGLFATHHDPSLIGLIDMSIVEPAAEERLDIVATVSKE